MRYIFSIIALCFFAGCECWADYPAYVKDKETNEPISDAKIDSSHDGDGLTDSSGFFEAGYSNVGGVGGCPDLSITISKEGYKTHFIQNANHVRGDTAIIYLEKE